MKIFLRFTGLTLCVLLTQTASAYWAKINNQSDGDVEILFNYVGGKSEKAVIKSGEKVDFPSHGKWDVFKAGYCFSSVTFKKLNGTYAGKIFTRGGSRMGCKSFGITLHNNMFSQ